MRSLLWVEGHGFEMFEGKSLSLALLVQGQAGLIALQTVTIQAGGFTASSAAVLDKGVAYFLPYFVDVNDNGGCDATPTDAVWRLAIPAVNGHIHATIFYGADDMTSLGCAGFP